MGSFIIRPGANIGNNSANQTGKNQKSKQKTNNEQKFIMTENGKGGVKDYGNPKNWSVDIFGPNAGKNAAAIQNDCFIPQYQEDDE